MNVTAPGKLLALCLVIAGCFAYIITTLVTHGGDTTPAWATITLATGYLVGNGVGALRGQPTAGVFAPTPELELEPAPERAELTADELDELENLLARIASLDELERRRLSYLAKRGR